MKLYLLNGLISLAGVIISALTAIIIARKQSDNENRKNISQSQRLELEAFKIYEEKIIAERIRCYPELYRYLSYTAKVIKKNGLDIKTIKELLEQVEEWDNKYAIYFSLDTVKFCSEFRILCEKFVSTGSNFLECETILTQIGEFENLLKSDIGVWGLNSNGYPSKKQIIHYEEYFF